jgi:hypothetical protein
VLLLNLLYPQQSSSSMWTMAVRLRHLLLLAPGTLVGPAAQAVREAAAGSHQATKLPLLLQQLQ